MSKIKLIIGNSPSHLLAMAETMALRKNYQIIQGDTLRKSQPFSYLECTRETQLIIIQDLPVLDLYSTVSVLSSGEIIINRKYETPYTHNVEVVITCRCRAEWLIKDPRLLKRVTLLESRVSSLPDVDPVQVPASFANTVGDYHFKDQVIILSWDKATGSTTVTTWGNTEEDKEQADQIGQALKSRSEWDKTSFVRKMAGDEENRI